MTFYRGSSDFWFFFFDQTFKSTSIMLDLENQEHSLITPQKITMTKVSSDSNDELPSLSFCWISSAPIEEGNESKPVVKNCDMSEEMKARAIELVVSASSSMTVERDIAMYIKKAFDAEFGKAST